MIRMISRSALALILFSALVFAQYSTPVRDVENPARTPFVESGAGTFNPSFVNVVIAVGSLPPGQRLVIDYVAVQCETDTDDNISRVAIGVNKKMGGSHETKWFPIPVQKQGNTYSDKPAWVAAQSLRLYSDSVNSGGSTHYVDVRHSKVASTPSCSAFVSGYTIAVP